ncbi:MAG: Gfo/Idh/MocA family oxidoreductase, partial [Acidobacteriota bacterium]
MNRRHFLMNSAAALGTSALSAAASPNDTIRIAVVGMNGRGKSHLQAFTSLPKVDLVAVCDIDDQVLAKGSRFVEEKRGKAPTAYKDLRKLLEDKSIDAISIATPNHLHTLQTVWACQAGKDVYVEKPCSHDMWEAKQIVAAARKYDRIVQQGSQSRSNLALQEAVQKMKEGVIGDVYHARGLCYKWRKTIGKTPEEPVPAGVDDDLWLGPAPKRAFTRNR